MRLSRILFVSIVVVLAGSMPMKAVLADDQQPETVILITKETRVGDASALEMLDWLIFHYETIHFDLDSYKLTEEACNTLLRKARWIEKQKEAVQIVIVGHCDQRGSDGYNMYLGTMRANAVKQYLVGFGIPHECVIIQSAGYRQPLMDGDGELAWAVNRRVQVRKP